MSPPLRLIDPATLGASMATRGLAASASAIVSGAPAA